MANLEDYFGTVQRQGVCILDVSGMAVSAAMAQKAELGEDVVSLGFLRHMILMSLLSNRRRFKSEYPELVLACDAPNNWRKIAHLFYKAHRQALKDADSFDWDTYFVNFNIIKDEIRAIFPFKMIQVDGAEGDDIVGVLSNHLTDKKILIHGKDKDFHQCCANPNVKLWNPMTQKLSVDDNPKYNIFAKCCRGDAGDGVPNILSPTNSFTDKIRQKQLRETKIQEYFTSGIADFEIKSRFDTNQKLIDFNYIPDDLKKQIIAAYADAKSVCKPQLIQQYLMQKDLARISANFLGNMELFT